MKTQKQHKTKTTSKTNWEAIKTDVKNIYDNTHEDLENKLKNVYSGEIPISIDFYDFPPRLVITANLSEHSALETFKKQTIQYTKTINEFAQSNGLKRKFGDNLFDGLYLEGEFCEQSEPDYEFITLVVKDISKYK